MHWRAKYALHIDLFLSMHWQWFSIRSKSGQPVCAFWDIHLFILCKSELSRLIEEFMLLANMAVAHQIYRSYPELAMLRRHPQPKGKPLREAVRKIISFPILFPLYCIISNLLGVFQIYWRSKNSKLRIFLTGVIQNLNAWWFGD